jgi:hypothetical protein
MNDTLDLNVVETIVLDIDDTLNSLTLTIMGSIFGCPVGPYDYNRFPTEVGYDIISAVNKMKNLTGDDEWQLEEFWNAIPRDLWATAPLAPEWDYLIKRSAQLVGKENVLLASTPTKCPEAHAGKVDWINTYMPKWMHRQYFITPRKWHLANSASLLIDDHDLNIEKFREEGGQALIVPRPWNNSHGIASAPRTTLLSPVMQHLVDHLGELDE